MILKICGITSQEDADAAVAGGANAIGFNFYPGSPRYVTPECAAGIATAPGVRRVGVFVNEPRERVQEIGRVAALDVAQLHGEEAPTDYPAGIAVWKAARVEPGFDFGRFADCPAEALVLDGPPASRTAARDTPSTGGWWACRHGASFWPAGWTLRTWRRRWRWCGLGA
jgi:phosphoribosylanthranilate isomerase